MIPPDQFADLIAQASDEQLAEGMASNRDAILQEIFNRWPDQFRSDAARDVKAVIEWRITRPEGGEDRWQIKLESGSCSGPRGRDVPGPRVGFPRAPPG